MPSYGRRDAVRNNVSVAPAARRYTYVNNRPVIAVDPSGLELTVQECEAARDSALEMDPRVRYLVGLLADNEECYEPKICCVDKEYCDSYLPTNNVGNLVTNFYSDNSPPTPPCGDINFGRGPGILLCGHRESDADSLKITLRHELIHALDFCTTREAFDHGCRPYVCLELRAVSGSLECNHYKDVGRRARCIKEGASRSSQDHCGSLEAALEAAEDVYELCVCGRKGPIGGFPEEVLENA